MAFFPLLLSSKYLLGSTVSHIVPLSISFKEVDTLSLAGRNAVITGAGSGIGRAIAVRLVESGVNVFLMGRTAAKLESVRDGLRTLPAAVHTLAVDLDRDENLLTIRAHVERTFDRLDILVHSAGVIAMAPLSQVSAQELDLQYRTNARSPLLLTQSLLPLIAPAHGQIVFINSSLGVRTKEHAGAYAASKHALKAIADTLRAELNPSGVRVLSVFPGNTATEMQQQVCRELEQAYRPENMLQPDDVATAVVHALMLPATAELTDLHVRPARK
jgi:NADP-dependent 3-hydroxy acid dehydrogenase YdfG